MGGIDATFRQSSNCATFFRAGLCVLLWSPVLTISLTVNAVNGLAETTANTRAHGKYYTDLRDYGISSVGSRSVDQAMALANAIAATPDGGTIFCAAGTVMYVSGITITHRQGLRFIAAGQGYANGGQCQVHYIGSDNGILLNLDSDYDLEFDGWSFGGPSDALGHGALYTVSINKVTSCAAGGVNSSHHTFKNGAVASALKSNAVAFAIGATPSGVDCGQNSEFMHFENMSVDGAYTGGTRYGTGFYLAHSNVKGITLDRIVIGNLLTYVNAASGSSYKAYETRGGNTTTYYTGYGSENTIIEGDDFEQGCQVLVATGGGYWRFSGGRYDIFDRGCGTSSRPLFALNAQSILELDYPSMSGTSLYLGGRYAAQSTLILHGTQNGNSSLTGPFVVNPHAIGLDNVGSAVWLAGGQVKVGSLNYPGFGATNKGYGSWTQYGMPMIGYGVRQNSGLDPGTMNHNQCSDWNDGEPCPPRDSLFIGNSHVAFTGMWPIPFYSETCTYTGASGSTTWYVNIFPKDSAGKRSGKYPDGALVVSCSGAASTLNSSSYLTVTWPRVTGASNYDVVLVKGTMAGELIATVTDPGAGTTVTYNIQSGSTGDRFNYSFPTFYESAVTSFYGKAVNFYSGVPLTCYSDNGSTNTTCRFNSSINLASGKTIQFNGSQIASGNLSDGPFTQIYKGAISTSSGTSDNMSIVGVTSSSHCSLTATNSSAASNITSTYISAKSSNQIKITHAGISGMTYDVLCTPN